MFKRLLAAASFVALAMSFAHAKEEQKTTAGSTTGIYDYGYYDDYDAGYFDDNIYDDDWFYDYYDHDNDYDYYERDWYDWDEEGLFD